MEQLSYLERVKIQSEILLPLYRRLRADIGEEHAARLLRAAVREYAAAMGAQARQATGGTSLDKLRALMPVFAADDALDIDPVADTDHEMSLDVRGCRYADYFHAIGEPEFGAMVTCEIDPPLTEGIGADLSLVRSQTIMAGGGHCDFRWKLRS